MVSNAGNQSPLPGSLLTDTRQDPVREVVFVDSTVAGFDKLQVALRPGLQVVVLSADRDGIVQITNALKNKAPLDAIHIVSHGNDGMIKLGSTVLTSATLGEHADDLARIGTALTFSGDILLYGCDVAETGSGRAFIQDLAEAIGADVAASTDDTGAAKLGGDWELEATVGVVESGLAFDVGAREAYPGLLAPVTDNFDTNPGIDNYDGTYTSPYQTSFTRTIDGLVFTFSISGGDGGGFEYRGNFGETGTGDPSIQAFAAVYNTGNTETVTITAAGSADFRFISLYVDNNDLEFGDAATVAWYNNSASLGSQPLATTAAQTVTANTVVDEIRITSTDLNIFMDTFKVTADVTPPLAPSVPDLDAGSDTGSSSTDNITSDATPTFTGTAEANATVTVISSIAGTLGTTAADGAGNWSFTSGALTQGTHNITATATDAAGNTSTASAALSITIDTTAPSAPSTPDLEAGSDTGSSGTDDITNHTTPTFTGTAEANATVTVISSIAGTLGTTAADGAGNWSFTSGALTQGTHNITATATDAAGNTSTASAALSITIDTTAPSAPSTPDLEAGSDTGSSGTDDITNDTTPTFTGTAEANATVTVISSVAGTLGTTAADGAGAWSFTSGALTAGTHNITATATDAAGNTSAATSGLSITIDTTGPSTPAEPAGGLQVYENASSGAGAGTVTATDPATITWSLDDNAGNRFAINAANGAVTVQAGASFDTETEPTVDITVRATDAAGNTATSVLTVDILNVNEPPVVGGVFGDTSSQVVAGAGFQNLIGLDDATVGNVDSADYNGGFLTLAQGSGTANGSWGLDGSTATSGGDNVVAAGETIAVGGTAIGTVNAANDGQGGNDLSVEFNSIATSARIQTLLRTLTYSAPNGLGARSFTLTLNDADGTANGGDQDAAGSFGITVTPNPPVVSNLSGDSVTAANNAAVAIDAGGNATVTDADSPNFNGGNLAITRTGGLSGDFSLSGSGAAGVSAGPTPGTADGIIAGGEVVYVDGVAIGTIAGDGQGANNLQVNFGASATPARVQSLIRALQYGATTGGAHTFNLTVTDAAGGATSTPAGFTVTINAAPVITGQAVLATFESTPVTITLDDLVVSDADNSYPADFTLSVQDGANYSRIGATITPDDGFSGDLTVPVSVNDGTDDSNVYNLSVYVTTTIVVSDTTDSGPGTLRQALVDARNGDVIDISAITGTVVLTSGPLVIDKNLTITGASQSAVTISGNNSNSVLTVTGATVTLTDLAISDGMSATSGGGIYNDGTLTLLRVTLSYNESTGGDGGGIYNDGTLVAINTTVSSNTASGSGGGIAGNGTTTLNHCTIADNQAASAGGLYNSAAATLTMSNTIVADNTPGDCIDSGTIVSNVANLIADGTCSPDVVGDPGLGPLQDNYGSTFTHALTAGSPAIDAADAGTSISTDQRGEPRPMDGDGDGSPGSDIGSFEYQPGSDTGVGEGGSSGGGGCFLSTIIRF